MVNQPINDEIVFDIDLGAESLAYLHDHTVGGATVVPMTLYLEMALAMTSDALETSVDTLNDIRIHQPLNVPAHDARDVQVIIQPEMPGAADFWVFSTAGIGQGQQLHATGKAIAQGRSHSRAPLVVPEHLSAQCPDVIDVAQHYAAMRRRGIIYGPCFQPIAAIWRGLDQALVELHLPRPLEDDADVYHLHPALLDGAFQGVAIACSRVAADADVYLPVGIDTLASYARLESPLWAHVALVGATADAETLTAIIIVYDSQGRVAAHINGLQLQRVGGATVVSSPAPAPAIEQTSEDVTARLAAIWAEVLQLASVAHDDDFFELGGDSLMASQIATKAQRAGIMFTPQQLLEQRTIAGLLVAT